MISSSSRDHDHDQDLHLESLLSRSNVHGLLSAQNLYKPHIFYLDLISGVRRYVYPNLY